MTEYGLNIHAFIACATSALRGLDVDKDGKLIPASIDDAVEHAWKMAGDKMDTATKRKAEAKFRAGARQ